MGQISSSSTTSQASRAQQAFFWVWKRFCQFVVLVFYRRFEVAGLESLPRNSGLLLCANHVNALADAVILQAATPVPIRPLARSGLFKVPVMKTILHLIGAVPVYRRKDNAGPMQRNEDSFARCYELLAEQQTIVIFPEGQSHSDPYLHQLKTGAARIALGAAKINSDRPVVLPVGLTFSRKGKFRGDVLVNFAQPVDLEVAADLDEYAAVELINERIREGLESVTLNAKSWRDIDLVRRVELFFAHRNGKNRSENLSQSFRAQQRLMDAQSLLRLHEPDRVRSLMIHLKTFERLCKCCGINDYHLNINYRPVLIFLYLLRSLLILIFGLGISIWAWINSAIPYLITRQVSQRMAKSRDQYDSARVLIGLPLFIVFWGAQSWYVYNHFGFWWSILYFISLIIGSTVALYFRGEWKRMFENIRVFILFARKQQLREYLMDKRQELEKELAKMVRIARRLSNKNEKVSKI
jgi:1-acyl-sn-glycerol-3-phosphate acyltransferase